jgi:2-(1,2-epoxy-1,2-dihydrophenyl)acetyl-CoA isomerase
VTGEAVPGLVVEQDGPLLRIAFDRPGKRNSLTDGMVAGLTDVIQAAGNDESVRAVLLAGTGEHFCSGFDIVARNSATKDSATKDSATKDSTAQGGPNPPKRPRAGSIQRRLPGQAHRLIPVLLETQVPIVAAVRGWAAGIGLGFALAADVTVASRTATFWAPFSSRGFTPDSGVSWLLPRRVGEVRARKMLLLGEKVDGARAAEWGMIDRCVPDDQLEQQAEEVAHQLASSATVAIGLTKWLTHAGRDASLEQHLRNEAFAMELSSRSEDFKEGLAAFASKRPTKFTGR